MMTSARTLLGSTLLALFAVVVLPLHAQPAFSDGEVRSVDKEGRKITLKHGEIKNIDMPPMTMSFTVKNAKLLETVRPGDKVKFRAINDGGKFTVTELESAK